MDQDHSAAQRGMTLVESLIALLVVSVGVLAMVAMYARAVQAAGQAQYRTEASNLAGELLQAIAANVARDADGAVIASGAGDFTLNKFAVNAAGGEECAWRAATDSATATLPAVVSGWETRVKAASSGLPGAGDAGMYRVVVSNAETYNQVSVELCWLVPGTTTKNRHQVVGYIN